MVKWEYMNVSLSDGWRQDIREQLIKIGISNIKKIKGRNCGYPNEEYVAILQDNTQIRLGKTNG